MKIYHTPEDFNRLDYAVVTSGTFDGVHLGHQKILNRVKEIAARQPSLNTAQGGARASLLRQGSGGQAGAPPSAKGETVVITFWPHPRLVLHPEDRTLKLLNTFEEKAELLKEQGIQHLVRIPFTREFTEFY